MLRSLLPLAVACGAGLLVVLAWQALERHEADKIARILEAESYAARSELVRDLDRQLEALRKVARYWAGYGGIPSKQWISDAKIELSHFRGIRTILWSDPEADIRYATTPEELAFDNRPSDEQWRALSHVLEGVDPARSEAMIGPQLAADGHASYRVQVPVSGTASAGLLVALVDAHDLLGDLLRDQSPGYQVAVYWGDTPLFQRGEPAAGVPANWQREGRIRLSMGPLWRVVHVPNAELAASLQPRATRWLLWSGLGISLLLGVLVFLNGRLRANNASLARQVENRTKELADRTADLETIGESVSHDLRNPLNTLTMNAHLLRMTLDPRSREVREILDRVDDATGQMGGILDRLRSFSEVTHTTFERVPLDMVALVRKTFRERESSASGVNVAFELGPLPDCCADRTLVEILLVNLLSNALKYTRTRTAPRIEVTGETVDGVPVYSVRDNGIGFEPELAERLFEPFQRFAGDDAFDGDGLGLAVAARAVRRHGGRIWAQGEPGAGATFHFELGPGSRLEPSKSVPRDVAVAPARLTAS